MSTAPSAPRPKSGRRRARELALQGLYEWFLAKTEPALIEAHLRDGDEVGQCDWGHFKTLLYGCMEHASALDAVMLQYIDRPAEQLSPVEHGVLMIGLYELTHCLDIPYRVAINEAVELAKNFGGTDGHRYVNGVLDKGCMQLRAAEVQAYRGGRS